MSEHENRSSEVTLTEMIERVMQLIKAYQRRLRLGPLDVEITTVDDDDQISIGTLVSVYPVFLEQLCPTKEHVAAAKTLYVRIFDVTRKVYMPRFFHTKRVALISPE